MIHFRTALQFSIFHLFQIVRHKIFEIQTVRKISNIPKRQKKFAHFETGQNKTTFDNYNFSVGGTHFLMVSREFSTSEI